MRNSQIVRALIFPVLISFFPDSYAYPKEPFKHHCYAYEGTSKELGILLKAIHTVLEASKLSAKDFPKLGRTKISGDYSKPHTIRSEPIESLELADSILVDQDRFITFQVWGLNSRAIGYSDSISLLNEKDPDAVEGGLKGLRTFKYVELSYIYLFPKTDDGTIGGDFSKMNNVISVIRKGLLQVGCQQATCR